MSKQDKVFQSWLNKSGAKVIEQVDMGRCGAVTRIQHPEIKWHSVEIVGGPLDGQVRHVINLDALQKIETEVAHRQWKMLTYLPRTRDGNPVLVHPEFVTAFDNSNSLELITA